MAEPVATPDAIDEQAKAVERCLGPRIAEFRRMRGITLKSLSKSSGISEATLSRVENRQVSLNAYNLIKLGKILDVDISDFFHTDPVNLTTGRRAITRKGQGECNTSKRYAYEVLCAELSQKAMIPSINAVTARSLADAGGLKRHAGEEFIFVLSGSVEIHTEYYKPSQLEAGDSMYLDSQMAHAYVSPGPADAQILVVTA